MYFRVRTPKIPGLAHKLLVCVIEKQVLSWMYCDGSNAMKVYCGELTFKYKKVMVSNQRQTTDYANTK